MADNKDELDAFWDIGRLIPPKPKKTPTIAPKIAPQRVEAVSITVEKTEDTADETQSRLTLPKQTFDEPTKAPSLYASYENFSPLIQKVDIVNWKSTYNYYEFFCRQAASLYGKKGTKCEEVHFFSYVAQYSQLNRRQLEWYLWWRECVRNGIYMSVDISYIYLLIFEILNLGNSVDTRASLDVLIALWQNYRNTYPQLMGVLGDWIYEYSLIHNLPIGFPDERIDMEMISSTLLKEAFLSFSLTDPSLLTKTVLSFCNSYNYRKSKFYKDEQYRAAYDTHIPAAMEYFLSHIDVKRMLAEQPTKHLSGVSFTGALCSYKTRKHIEVDYIAFCDSHELKSNIGEIIKYTENKLRAHLGIRSRLTASLKNTNAKTYIDEYFSKTLSLHRDGETVVPEYEKLYDVKDTSFSLTSALDIEKQSWEVTERLVDAFDDAEEATALPVADIPEQIDLQDITQEGTGSETEMFFAAIQEYRPFFDAILRNDTAALNAHASQHHVMIEAVVDEINEKAADIFGDILIEEDESGYQIIAEYKTMFN